MLARLVKFWFPTLLQLPTSGRIPFPAKMALSGQKALGKLQVT
jgi:hypothetical protein